MPHLSARPPCIKSESKTLYFVEVASRPPDMKQRRPQNTMCHTHASLMAASGLSPTAWPPPPARRRPWLATRTGDGGVRVVCPPPTRRWSIPRSSHCGRLSVRPISPHVQSCTASRAVTLVGSSMHIAAIIVIINRLAVIASFSFGCKDILYLRYRKMLFSCGLQHLLHHADLVARAVV